MSGHLVVPGHYKPIQKPICFPGGNSVQKAGEIHLCIDY